MTLTFQNNRKNHLIKRHLSFVLLTTLLFLFQGCEKDDICSEETQKTPLVRISFLDDQGNEKQVPLLQVGFEGAKTIDDDNNPDTPEIPQRLPSEGPMSLTEVLLPLDTQSNSTTFYFIRNSGTEDDDDMNTMPNIDTIQVIYSRNYDYINRACGYKVTFQALSESQTTFDDNDTWISSIFVEKSTVENSEETHIIIRH